MAGGEFRAGRRVPRREEREKRVKREQSSLRV
jgi:hypothetical protein